MSAASREGAWPSFLKGSRRPAGLARAWRGGRQLSPKGRDKVGLRVGFSSRGSASQVLGWIYIERCHIYTCPWGIGVETRVGTRRFVGGNIYKYKRDSDAATQGQGRGELYHQGEALYVGRGKTGTSSAVPSMKGGPPAVPVRTPTLQGTWNGLPPPVDPVLQSTSSLGAGAVRRVCESPSPSVKGGAGSSSQ